MKDKITFSFTSFRELKNGPMSTRIGSFSILTASFFLGSFLTSALLTLSDTAYEYVGGIFAVLVKLAI